jgi:hypothetical protein
MRSVTVSSILVALLLAACAAEEEKVQQAAPDYGAEDGKDDSAARPSSIEPIDLGQIETTDFTWRNQFRAFTFAGRTGQEIDLYVDGLDGLDTVLYLYKVSATTGRPFGRPLAANDDTAEPGWVVDTNPEPNPYSSNVTGFALPEDRDYALVATTFWQLYEGQAEVVVKGLPTSQTCGGFANQQCPEGQVCYFEPGMCTVADMIGTCIVPPIETGFSCAPPNPSVDNRVCGCDGNTYVDACHARMLGVSTAHDGPCAAACQPECGAIGSRSEGWYDCDGLIRWEFCAECTSECRAIGSRSEGWYSTCDDQLIKYAECG